jgi:DNA polymerase-3 subunit gamma/tau
VAQLSLYRRYRPGTFGELRGQDHVSRALQHAIAAGTEGQAYLFSGPRGTGKTSTARILAKALNCTDLRDGEPCGTCDSCLSIADGSSYDLHELDAASNNGVDAIRDLISRAAVASPGRTKVYILDEVHMLSTAASNALLKTLEEPPDHVVFVLATTDPQKVLPTIRSRTQHFEFSLLSAEELTEYVQWVITDAGLALDHSVIPEVVRMGRGSARDTLSALDRVAALGGIEHLVVPTDDLTAGLAARDAGAVLKAVDAAVTSGLEPRTLGEAVLTTVRDAFLVAVGGDTPHLSVDDRERSAALARGMGTAALTRTLETVGSALVDMRQASEPRIPLEAALIRICVAGADTSTAALLERIERLEAAFAAGVAQPTAHDPATAVVQPTAPVAPGSPTTPATNDPEPSTAAVPEPEHAPLAEGQPPSVGGNAGDARGPDRARAALQKRRGAAAPTASSQPEPAARSGARPTPPPAVPGQPARPAAERPQRRAAAAAPEPAPEVALDPTPTATDAAVDPTAAAGSGPLPTLEGARHALERALEGGLKGMTRAIWANAEVVGLAGNVVTMGFVNQPTRDRAERSRDEVAAALSRELNSPVSVVLSVAGDTSGTTTPEGPAGSTATRGTTADATDEDPTELDVDPDELVDVPDGDGSRLQRVVDAFPGAELIIQEEP